MSVHGGFGKGTRQSHRTSLNKLYYGDNLEVLRKYIRDETVDLCYIDPPFNSKRNYNQIYNNVGTEDAAQAQAFTDTWTWDEAAERGFKEIISNAGGVFTPQSIDLISGLAKVLGKGSLLSYLVSMTLRVAEIYRVLKSTGCFYFHCDSTASHYLKLVLDTIFCGGRKGQYQNEIIWKRQSAHSDSKRYAKVSDTIFFYSKTEAFKWNKPYTEYDEEYLRTHYSANKEGRRFTYSDLTKPKGSIGYFYKLLNCDPPPNGWRMPETRAKEWLEGGRIEIPPTGKTPRYIRYLDEMPGSIVTNIWDDISPINSQGKDALHYPTQKPEALLDRIIRGCTNERDVVLDAYCGCGTTVSVAQLIDREWIGIDITYQSISLILKRLEDTFGEKALETIELNGVPKDFESAVALANKKDDKTRKEFEKWFVLTYSHNRAAINEKKGGDAGIDGIAYVLDVNSSGKQESQKVLFSVKSNLTLTPSVVRDLNGTIERDGAVAGYLLTLYPMENMVKESKKYGTYRNSLYGKDFPKIQVVSAQEMLDGARLDLPTVLGVLKSASKKVKAAKQEQLL